MNERISVLFQATVSFETSQIKKSTNPIVDIASLNNSIFPSLDIKTSGSLLSSTSTTHSPMSSGVDDFMKSSIRSVSIESGRRSRRLGDLSSGIRQDEHNDMDNNSLRNQTTNALVTDNLRVQHQREKEELSELNDRFRGKN